MSYIGNIPLPQATEERIERTATAGQTSFTGLTYVNHHISVYLNGVKLDNADFTATDGTTVTLATGAAAGDTVSFVSTTQTFAMAGVANAFEHANSISTAITVTSGNNRFQIGDTTFSNSLTIQGKLVILDGPINLTGTANITGTLSMR
tara:strand:- start:6 stop:452 length:447 start_codon:yes stop_codon:yes gene_type:complete